MVLQYMLYTALYLSICLSVCLSVTSRGSTKMAKRSIRQNQPYDSQKSLHCESKKGCHPNHGYNFVNSWSFCKILSLLQQNS